MPDIRPVQVGTPSGVKTRVFFYVTDATFAPITGITTGSAGFAMQRSFSGSAWATSSDLPSASFTEVGNGLYYADFRTITTNDAGSIIRTRLKTTASLETPGDSLFVIASDPFAAVASPLAGDVVASTTGTTTTLPASAPATADIYVGATLAITGGVGAGQSRIITAYSSGRVATHAAWTTNPNSSSVYQIFPAAAWLGGYSMPELASISDVPATMTPAQAMMLIAMHLRNGRLMKNGAGGFVIYNGAGTPVLSATVDDTGSQFVVSVLA